VLFMEAIKDHASEKVAETSNIVFYINIANLSVLVLSLGYGLPLNNAIEGTYLKPSLAKTRDNHEVKAGMVKLPDQRAMRSSGVGSARLSLHNVSSFETSGPSLGLSGPDGSSGPEFPGRALGYSARRSLRPSVGGSALAVPPPWTGTAQARARRSSSIEQQYLQDSGPGSGEMHSIGEEDFGIDSSNDSRESSVVNPMVDPTLVLQRHPPTTKPADAV